MLPQNMIPGMKVHVKGYTSSDGTNISRLKDEPMYIVRMMKRDDETRSKNSKNMCVVNTNKNNSEGNYTRADLIDLIELPKSFDKRNEKYR